MNAGRHILDRGRGHGNPHHEKSDSLHPSVQAAPLTHRLQSQTWQELPPFASPSPPGTWLACFAVRDIQDASNSGS